MKKITTSDLARQLDGPDDFVLINVLPRASFEKQHIQGSQNVPVDDRNFTDRVVKMVGGDKNQNVIVYCANKSCDASLKAVRRLEQAGFSNVVDYEAGMEAWQAAGHPVDSGSAAGARR